MADVLISPVFNTPYIQDADGNPLSGGRIYAYEAGSNSVLKDTYTSAAGDVAHSNPIILDSSGTLPEALWLIAGESYNLVLTDSSGTTVLKNFDDVMGVLTPTPSESSTSSIWVNVPGATYLSTTQFLVPGNFTAEFKVGNRARLTTAGGFIYGTVTAVTFSTPNTTVTITPSSGVLDSSLSASDYSQNSSAPAATVDAGGVSYFDSITYTTANTVGKKLQEIDADIAALDGGITAEIGRDQKVWTTSGTGSAYTLTPTPAITIYADNAHWYVKFHAASSGTPTININGVGAKNLRMYDSSGTLVAASVAANQLSDIAFDTANDCWVVLDTLPEAASVAPRGQQVFTSNDTFTVPANVYTVKVTCVGGGGGGGGGATQYVSEDYIYRTGGTGGNGGSGIKYVSVTPGADHLISIGAGGTAGTSGFGGGGNGGTGGSTTFGASLVVATGGSGGIGAVSSDGADGSPGYGSVADYGYFGVGFKVSTSSKGTGGAGGTGDFTPGSAGTAGMCIVEW